MVTLMILAVVTMFVGCGMISYQFMDSITVSYFGCNSHVVRTVLLATGWPLGLPFFFLIFSHEIVAFSRGKDWADENVPPDSRVRFREEYMENHHIHP